MARHTAAGWPAAAAVGVLLAAALLAGAAGAASAQQYTPPDVTVTGYSSDQGASITLKGHPGGTPKGFVLQYVALSTFRALNNSFPAAASKFCTVKFPVTASNQLYNMVNGYYLTQNLGYFKNVHFNYKGSAKCLKLVGPPGNAFALRSGALGSKPVPVSAATRMPACPGGFTQSASLDCIDIDECKTGQPCGPNANCTNTAGGYTCTCNPGYTGDGTTCTDVDECLTNNGGCPAPLKCVNFAGGYNCSCPDGYQPDPSLGSGDPLRCIDVDECLTNNGGCSKYANCTNTIGGRNCTCRDGFVGDGLTCTDVDECANATQPLCNANATCVNDPGSYHCQCPACTVGDPYPSGSCTLPVGDSALDVFVPVHIGRAQVVRAYNKTYNFSEHVVDPQYYRVVNTSSKLYWAQARAWCSQVFGNDYEPASFHSAAQEAAVAAAMVAAGLAACPCDPSKNAVPIGGSEDIGFSRMSWADGSPVDYLNFLPGADTPAAPGALQGNYVWWYSGGASCPPSPSWAWQPPSYTGGSTYLCSRRCPGTVLSGLSICDVDNGGCDVNADCVATGSTTRTCTCKAGFVGNGIACTCGS